MLKTIVLLALCGLAASHQDEFQGEITTVLMFTPTKEPWPQCYTYEVLSEKGACTCADGKPTSLQTSFSKNMPSLTVKYPLSMIEKPEEVDEFINVACTCGEDTYTSRYLARPIGENYQVYYATGNKSFLAPGINTFLIAKNIESRQEIQKIVDEDAELSKKTKGIELCSKELFASLSTKTA